MTWPVLSGPVPTLQLKKDVWQDVKGLLNPLKISIRSVQGEDEHFKSKEHLIWTN